MGYLRIFVFVLVLVLIIPGSTGAQEDATCPALVEEALATVGEACAGIGRNQACYGNIDVTATGWNDVTLTDFANPGDVTGIVNVASLKTAALNPEKNAWGVALLALQANLPDTLPGQNVTFVLYGDVQLQSEVPPDLQTSSSPTCTVTAAGGVNLRSGPGTGYAIAGGLTAGDAVMADGRNEAGDWLRIDLDGSPAWVYTPLVTLGCEVETLAVVEAGVSTPAYTAPMQAFRFTSGVGQPACAEAPRDGLLVQAPKDTTVNFLINGVEIELGSTAFMRFDEKTLGVNILDGLARVTSAEVTQTAGPGLRIDVKPGEPPAEPVTYDAADVIHAPVDLLPETVIVQRPLPDGSNINVGTCAAGEGAVSVPGGQPVILRIGWFYTTPESVIDFANAVTNTATVNGQVIDLWSTIGPVWREDRFIAFRYWVIPDPAPGQYDVTVSYDFSRPVIDAASNTKIGSQGPFSCKVIVEG